MSAENDQDDPWLRFEHLLVGEPLPANPKNWDEMQRLVDLGLPRMEFIERDPR